MRAETRVSLNSSTSCAAPRSFTTDAIHLASAPAESPRAAIPLPRALADATDGSIVGTRLSDRSSAAFASRRWSQAPRPLPVRIGVPADRPAQPSRDFVN